MDSSNSNVIFSSDKPVIKRMRTPTVLFIEPFYGGSHKILVDVLSRYITEYTLVTLPAKKWHWRARCSALCIENYIPRILSEKVLFCSSVLNLTELLGLRPDLNQLRKVIYFHENQLTYPKQIIKERDVQYAYNQIISCLSADVVIFNSQYNKSSFLDNINSIIKMMPDHRPKNIKEKIAIKCVVIYFPMDFPKTLCHSKECDILHIVWPHRWEFDKGPDEFFEAISMLKLAGDKFKLSVLGETFQDVPKIFEIYKEKLKDEIVHFGYLESREDYYAVLCLCHVVISTAKHEFFGVSILEATYCGCFPLVPNALVYPEIYPSQCLYRTTKELYEKLHELALQPTLAVEKRKELAIDFSNYSCDNLMPEYKNVLKYTN